MCVAELEACLDRGTKGTQVLDGSHLRDVFEKQSCGMFSTVKHCYPG
jgi:hypothetical protein